ncbi:hypothetical protein BDW62DRAFT_216479 [Aspergillus aurantiobrunneus]
MAERKRGSISGRGRGRGRGRGGWRPVPSRVVAATEPTAPALGSLLATITRSDLEDSFKTLSAGKEVPNITGCKLVGSYNWLDRKHPTILVPGSPPAWTPIPPSGKLPEDSGLYFRDPNAARYAVHVFEPAVKAILQQESEFDFSKIDLVACSSTMGNLRRFITEPDKGFRLVVEAVGSAVFLVRRENSPTQTIPNVFGYGHTFPEANTTWSSDVKGSESHQRIIQYEFAGLSCLVRYQADGYLPKLHQPTASHKKATAVTPEDLLTPLAETTVSRVGPEAKQVLTTESGGEVVPQSATFDLKTRSAKKEYADVVKGELPRLWLAQVPNFVVGFHKSGLFDDVRVVDVRREVQQWEKEHESDLRKLAALLDMLITFANGQPDGRLEVVFQGEDGDGSLELREVGGEVNRCISDSLKKRWTARGFGGRELEEKKELKAKNVGWGKEGEEDWSERWQQREEEEESFWGRDSESEKDFTACSASSCGYCGHCGY